MSEAWAAWKAATRFLFWAMVQTITRSINANKEAERQVTAFHPKNPSDLYACGFALFIYDASWDSWRGYWRDKNERPGLLKEAEWSVTNWSGIPWNKVEFSDTRFQAYDQIRAVPLDYCQRHLRLGQQLFAA
jgi:hypothetical protein